MTTNPENHAAALEKSQSQPDGRERSYISSLQAWVCSLLVGRRVESVEFQADGMVWFLTLDSGRRVYVEPVISNRGCSGMVAGMWPPIPGELNVIEFCEAFMGEGAQRLTTPSSATPGRGRAWKHAGARRRRGLCRASWRAAQPVTEPVGPQPRSETERQSPEFAAAHG